MKRAGPYLVALLLLIVGLLMVYRIPFASGFTQIPVDEGDSRFNHYLLEHSYRWVSGHPQHEDLWSPPMFYPATNTIAYSDAMTGYGWWYWPLRAIGLGPQPSFVLWMALSSVINFGAMLWFLTRLFRIELVPSAIGAFLFSFAIPRTAQLGHQQLLPQFYILCLIAGLVLLIRRGHHITAWTMVLAGAVLQFYSGFYHLWFAVFGVTWLFIGGLLFAESRAMLRDLLRRPLPVIAAAATAALCLWPLLHLYLQALHEAGPRSMATVNQMLPRIQSWIYPGTAHWMYGRLCEALPMFSRLPFPNEHILGVGPVTTVLIVLGLARWRHAAWGRAMLVAMAGMLTFTLFYSEHWNPWELVAAVFPGGNAIRAVTRVALLLLIPACMALAMYMQTITSTWVKAALVLLVVCEQGMSIATFDGAAAQSRIDAIAEQAVLHDGPFYFAHEIDNQDLDRFTDEEYVAQLDAMWAGLQVNRPTLNGYSGNAPPGWIRLYFNSIRQNNDYLLVQSHVAAWLKQNGIDFSTIRMVDDSTSIP